MKFLIIGLGSMGKRRIRCLKSLGINSIVGYDINQQRAIKVGQEYSIKISNKEVVDIIEEENIDAVIVSTSPDSHVMYIEKCIEKNIDCFIEASVTDIEGLKRAKKRAGEKNISICPSCTMKYYNGPQTLKKLIKEKVIGECLYFNYVTGQYLPDWHPWENIQDYYVSNKETGGGRELVPFELAWLNDTFGNPKVINSMKRKLSNMEADIDDFYCFTLEYGQEIVGNIIIEVLSRPIAKRRLLVVGTEGTISYCGESNTIVIDNITTVRKTIELEKGSIEEDYINPEEPYIKEIEAFMGTINKPDSKSFPNSLEEDISILELLGSIEENAK